MALMFLNGSAMRGEPMHHLVAGSPFVRAVATAPRYRFYAVGSAFPGLLPVAHGGAAVEGEVYEMDLTVLRDRLLPAEPPELELGVVELADGDAVLGMLLRRPPVSFPQLTDITQLGSWRRFVSRESTKDTRAEVTP
ncbi:gamma-glutamylcyclotransferase [Kibdelosporangium lantanae]